VDALINRVYFTAKNNDHIAPTKKYLDDPVSCFEIKHKDNRTNDEANSKYQAYFENFAKSSDLNAAVKYNFFYEWTNPMIEKLQADGFYPATGNVVVNNVTGVEHEEWRAYLLHTIWLSQTDTLSRWFEWSILMRTYTELKPFKSNKYQVSASEIKGPICKDCEMSVTHSGKVVFVEERDTTAGSGYPTTITFLPACNWDLQRDGYQFTSLQ